MGKIEWFYQLSRKNVKVVVIFEILIFKIQLCHF
jgi:hypothetical protein